MSFKSFAENEGDINEEMRACMYDLIPNPVCREVKDELMLQRYLFQWRQLLE
jgi:hypothetical protein